MTNPNAADTAVGERLRQAREAAGLSLAEVSARSKMPVRILAALEAGDWASLGAPVFVRGQARSYARMLGIPLDAEALPSPFTTSQIPSLVSHSYIPRYRYVAENLARRAVYVVLTVALVVPIWLATRTHLDGASPSVSPLDPPVDPMSGAAALDGRTTVVASMAPMPAPASRVRAALLLEATGETWFQALAADGSVRESGMLRTGDRRELDPSVVARVVLGNSGAAQLSRAGRRVDLSPYTRANVARFTLSSDGSPAPIAP